MPSIGSSDSQATRSTVAAVLLLPAPVSTVRRPRSCAHARTVSSRSSASRSVADSPVVPPITTPWLPLLAWKSSSRAQASKSTAPLSSIGVTRGTRLPENMRSSNARGGTGDVTSESYAQASLKAATDARKVATHRRSRYTAARASAGKPNRPPKMKQHLAVSAIGSDRTGMVHELTRVISESGGNISESRMASLGNEFAMLLLVSGNWHALAKLETELKRLADTSSLSIHLKRTEPRTARTDMLPYSIDVVCLDQSGIVSGLSGFFATRGIDIAEVSTRSYPAAHTGAPMFAVQMIVNVPSRIHVAHLREEFMEFCDSLNLDAILEPVKS